MIDNGYTYTDCNGVELNQDDRVQVGDWQGIATFSDFDGDMDEYGRAVVLPPKATVVFEDGQEDTFPCSHGPQDDTIVFEDLRKVTK